MRDYKVSRRSETTREPKESYVILTSFIDTTKEAEIYQGECAIEYARATLFADRKHVSWVAVYDSKGLVMKLINKELATNTRVS